MSGLVATTNSMEEPDVSRLSRQASEKLHDVEVGDHDIVSRAAYAARIELCAKQHPKSPHLACTRAAGHTESVRGSASVKHVAAGLGYKVLAVWL